MRTTLSIDDDVLAAAKGQALVQGRSIGEVISDASLFAARSLQPRETGFPCCLLLKRMPR